MSSEMLRIYTDESALVGLSTPPFYPELPSGQEELRVDVVGRVILSSLRDTRKNGFNEYDNSEYPLTLGELRNVRLQRLAAIQFEYIYEPSPANNSHQFVGLIENGGRMSTPSPRMDCYPLARMRDGEAHTLLDCFGRPLLSGYPLHESRFFLTYPAAKTGLVLIDSERIKESQLIAYQSPARLHNDSLLS